MKLDFVHDVQAAYRKLVDTMARPGKIADFSPEAGGLGGEAPCLPSTALLAMLLLDTEVTFKVYSKRESEVAAWFNQLTYAKETNAEAADFLFVCGDAEPDGLLGALRAAKAGDLVNPHQSATLIVETEAIGGEALFRLTGPGIAHSQELRLSVHGQWAELRAERNAEFPMGVDMIFVDAANHAVSLPRTTKIEGQVNGAWVM